CDDLRVCEPVGIASAADRPKPYPSVAEPQLVAAHLWDVHDLPLLGRRVDVRAGPVVTEPLEQAAGCVGLARVGVGDPAAPVLAGVLPGLARLEIAEDLAGAAE